MTSPGSEKSTLEQGKASLASENQSRREIPHCTHWGAFTAITEGDRIVEIRPFDLDPAPSRMLGAIPEWLTSPLRIDQPMVRKGWIAGEEKNDGSRRGTDSYLPVSWDEALDLIAQEVNRVRKTHGNASIFAGSYGWASSGRFHHPSTLLKRMLNQVGGYTGHTDTYSIAAGAVVLNRVLGNDDSYNGRCTSLENICRHTQALLVFGSLTPRTAQIEAGGMGQHRLEEHLEALARRNVRIINISPCRDDVPEYANAEWIPIRPNTDTALILALTHTIVTSNRHNKDFLARYCVGSTQFLDYVLGRSDGQAKNAAWASKICDVPADTITRLAETLVGQRSMITMSWALQRADHGEQPFWSLVALAAVIGQIGLPGGGFGMGYASLGGVGVSYPKTSSPAIKQGHKAIASFIPVARITDLLLNPGQPFDYDGKQYTFPDIRMVYWAGGNPFHHQQDLNRLKQAWSKPETIVVQDPFWTPTACHADIVLPATTSLERNDLAANKRSNYILAMQQVAPPQGQARSDYDIFRALSRKLECEVAFSEGRDEMQWIEHLYTETAKDAHTRLGVELPSFDEFWGQGYVQLPSMHDFVYLADFRHDPIKHPLPTPSGKIEIYSDTIASFAYSDCPGHPVWLQPAEWLGSSLAKHYPFHLISSQPTSRLHSQLDFGRTSQESKKDGREPARLHPLDAARYSINDGDTIRLFNDRGACLATAQLDEGLQRGVAVLATGAWYAPQDSLEPGSLEVNGNPNVLTLDKGSSSLGQGSSAHTCLVGIEPVKANSASG